MRWVRCSMLLWLLRSFEMMSVAEGLAEKEARISVAEGLAEKEDK